MRPTWTGKAAAAGRCKLMTKVLVANGKRGEIRCRKIVGRRLLA